MAIPFREDNEEDFHLQFCTVLLSKDFVKQVLFTLNPEKAIKVFPSWEKKVNDA